MKQFKGFLLMVAFVIFGLICTFAQGQGNGNGNGMGGPPNPPAGYCAQNPGDPACSTGDNGIAVPIDQGDWLLVLVALAGGTYLLMKNKNLIKL